tara:strand:- start:43 stop:603 length:561 start_codon:yes stop_codon:yes gene_type:complete
MKNNTQNPTTEDQGVKTDSVQTDENVSVETTGNDNKSVDSIPYARFNEVTKQKKELEAKLKDYEAKQEADRIKAMEEQGKYKELNAELTSKVNTYEEKLNVYAEKDAKEREDLLSQLDDQDKEVYGSLSNDQLRKHLEKSKTQPVNTNTTQPIRDASGNTVKDWTSMSPQEKRDNWGAILKSYTKK